MLGRALQYAPLTVSTAQADHSAQGGLVDQDAAAATRCCGHTPWLGLGVWGAAYLGSEGKNKPSSSPSWVLGQGWGRGVRPT